jgi:hypothetical protein
MAFPISYNALEVCDVAEPPSISAVVRMCLHSVRNATVMGELRRSHVLAVTLSSLVHPVTRGPLGA